MDERHLSVVTDGDDVPSTALVPLAADSTQEEPKAPAHGVRGESPGARGCWALKRDGTACGASSLRDGDYCSAHSGLGIAKDPAGFSAAGIAASADSRRRRAALRLELGITRSTSIRGMLRGAVHVERERVVAAALSPLGDPTLGSAAKQRAALALLDAVEPQPKAALSVDVGELDPDGVNALGLGELRSLAASLTPPLPTTAD